MTGRRWFVRVVVLALIVLVIGAGTTMTAGMQVPPSNAGVMNVVLDIDCSVAATVVFDRSNLNRVGGGHQQLTATISFPNGVPPESAGQPITNAVMRLPGGTQEVTPVSQTGLELTFTRESILSLVGPVTGDFVFEVAGTLGPCTFSGQETLKISGPV